MKKIILSLAVAVAAISCNNSEENYTPVIDSAKEISFALLSSDTADNASRTVTTDDGEKWTVKWLNGDKVHAWSTSEDFTAIDEKLTAYNMVNGSLSEDGFSAAFTGTELTNDKVRLIYAVNAPQFTKATFTAQMNLVSQGVDMNAPLATLKGAYMINSELNNVADLTSDSGIVPVMQHVTAGIKLNLAFTGLPEGNTYFIKSVEVGGGAVADNYAQLTTLIKADLRASLDNGAGEEAFYLNNTKGVYTLNVSNSGTIAEETVYSMYMSAFPFNVEDGQKVKVSVYLTATLPGGGTTAINKVFDIENTSGSTIAFDRGRHHSLSKLCDFTGVKINQPLEGAGTVDDPFKVTTADHLKSIAADVANKDFKAGKYYVLENDIDLGCWDNEKGELIYSWSPIGVTGQIPFKGIFDGQGHTISGLYINVAANIQGLFGCVAAGVVKNLHVDGSVKGTSSCGGIAGQVVQGASMINCSFSGDVSASSNQVGGITGMIANKAVIRNCYNLGSVESKQNAQVGGIVGYNNLCEIYNCYNAGTVTGIKPTTGGVIGQFGSNATTGKQEYNYSLEGCVVYTATATRTGVDCTVKTDAEMQDQAFVDELNAYVATYNATTPAHAAAEWEAVAGGYPAFKK